MQTTATDRLESVVRYYSAFFPGTFKSAQGAELFDVEGRSYIDFFCGAGALNYGHNFEPAKIALLDYIASNGVAHSLDMTTEAKEHFLTAFDDEILKPRGLGYKIMLPGPAGTLAVEAALKLARLVTRRTNVIAFRNSFHGVSLGSLSVTSSRLHRDAAGIEFSDVQWLPFDDLRRNSEIDLRLEELRATAMGHRAPAAIILETIQAEGGLHTASPEWLHKIADFAKEIGALLILDDIQTGCGRVGTFFSFDGMGLQPDIVCLSKSLSAFGLPMAILLLRPQFDIWKPGAHSGTFRGNNHAFVTGKTALLLWRDDVFLRRVRENTEYFRLQLEDIVHSYADYFELRGRGFFLGLACSSGDFARRVSAEAFQRRLIFETCGHDGEVLKFLPPLNIDGHLLAEGIHRIRGAIDGATRSLR